MMRANPACGGCWRDCRYVDFRPHRGVMTFSDWKAALRRAADSGERTGSRKHITHRTVLGRMHEVKRDSWAVVTRECPHQGERLPVTIPDFIRWSLRQRAVDVRVVLGVPVKRAVRMKAALRVWELTKYARTVFKDKTPF